MPRRADGYRLLPRARRDLDGIWKYTAREWSVTQADRYFDALLEALDRIASGQATTRPLDRAAPHIRNLAIESHVIYFRTGPRGIEVVRILHEMMDASRHL